MPPVARFCSLRKQVTGAAARIAALPAGAIGSQIEPARALRPSSRWDRCAIDHPHDPRVRRDWSAGDSVPHVESTLPMDWVISDLRLNAEVSVRGCVLAPTCWWDQLTAPTHRELIPVAPSTGTARLRRGVPTLCPEYRTATHDRFQVIC